MDDAVKDPQFPASDNPRERIEVTFNSATEARIIFQRSLAEYSRVNPSMRDDMYNRHYEDAFKILQRLERQVMLNQHASARANIGPHPGSTAAIVRQSNPEQDNGQVDTVQTMDFVDPQYPEVFEQ